MKTKLREGVEQFRKASRIPTFNRLEVPPLERIQLAGSLCIEETLETLEAMGADSGTIMAMKVLAEQAIRTLDRSHFDMIKVADGLGDSDYVNEWARCEFGIEGGPIADEIQTKNMEKFGPGSRFREDGKVLKPPDWTPPDIGTVLNRQTNADWVVVRNEDMTQFSLTKLYMANLPIHSLDTEDRPMWAVATFQTEPSDDFDAAKVTADAIIAREREALYVMKELDTES
jgi:predicted HAD superfamily Cof-like phosphohydrolase